MAGRLEPLWSALGRQLRHPSGLTGDLVGRFMSLANRQPNDLAIDALCLAPTDRALELGFGPGDALRKLAARTPQGAVAGVDHSALMLARARRLNRNAISRGAMILRQGPFSPLPWPDSAFDKILMANVVYFFDAEGRNMAEARRVLRPGGLAAVYATDRSTMRRWPFSRPDTHRRFNADDLRLLLVQGGFSADDIRIEPHVLPFGIAGLVATARKA